MTDTKGEIITELPEYLKGFQKDDVDADTMASSSTTIPRISLKGKKFRLIEGGEEISKSDTLRVVILSVEPEGGKMIKAFYTGGYSAGDNAPPDCSSSNGITPDLWVSDPVNDRCSTCPKNAFGSATSTNGKKTKACRDSKRLWVVTPDNVEGTVYALNVPVTSLRALSEYGKHIKKNSLPLPAVITKVSMDEDAEFPQLIFSHDGFLDEGGFNTAVERHTSKDWLIGQVSGLALENKEAQPTLTEISNLVEDDAKLHNSPDVAKSKTEDIDTSDGW